jgi:hypothetical protein
MVDSGLWSDQSHGTNRVKMMANTETYMSGNVPTPSEATTDEKRAYLRKWALERAQGEAGRLPAIREARVEVKTHFGGGDRSGLGTDIITALLRGLRDELTAAALIQQQAPVGQIVLPEVTGETAARMHRIALITQMMLQENIQALTIEGDGAIAELRRFSKQ